MKRTPDAFGLRARLREERGFQLIELLLVISLLSIVLGAVLALLDVTGQTAPKHIERGQRVREGETAVGRITRDVQNAKSATVTSSRVLDLVVQVRTGDASVAYKSVRIDCSTGQSCVRTQGPVGGPLGSPETLVTGVANTDVFTPTPSSGAPGYIGVTLALSLQGSTRPYYLNDGAELRNAP